MKGKGIRDNKQEFNFLKNLFYFHSFRGIFPHLFEAAFHVRWQLVPPCWAGPYGAAGVMELLWWLSTHLATKADGTSVL